jgi:hypothetical protein
MNTTIIRPSKAQMRDNYNDMVVKGQIKEWEVFTDFATVFPKQGGPAQTIFFAKYYHDFAQQGSARKITEREARDRLMLMVDYLHKFYARVSWIKRLPFAWLRRLAGRLLLKV